MSATTYNSNWYAIRIDHLNKSCFSQITSLNIGTACFTLALSRRLSDGLQSLPKLQQVIITQPKLVQGIPTLKAIRCLRLVDLPEYVENWKWVGDIQGLEEIEVSFKNGSERLHFHDENSELRSISAMGTMKIVGSLPRYLQDKVPNLLLVVSKIYTVAHKGWIFFFIDAFLS